MKPKKLLAALISLCIILSAFPAFTAFAAEDNPGMGSCGKDGDNVTYVYQDGTDVGKTVEGIVTTDELNIRSGPGTGYDSVGKLYTDEVIKIFYQVTVGETTWGCTNQGWVSLKYVSLEG